MVNIARKNEEFLDEFYSLMEREESELDNLEQRPGGMSTMDRATIRLELEHEIIRAQWWSLIKAYDDLGVDLPELDKMRTLLTAADAKARDMFAHSRVEDLINSHEKH